MKKKNLIITILLLFVLLWMGTIFYLSSMNTNESNGKSKIVVGKIIEITSKVTHHHYSTDEKEKLVEKFNKPIRKIAHASVYFILSILILNFLLAINFEKERKYSLVLFITILICFLFAITDEYHQTFVKGRTGQFSDVLIDTSGAIVSSVIFIIIDKKKAVKNKKGLAF